MPFPVPLSTYIYAATRLRRAFEEVPTDGFIQRASGHEYDSLGEQFEKIERQTFGGDGFDIYVDKVAALEKQLGIYDLSQFTPK